MAQCDNNLRRCLGSDVYLEVLQKTDEYFLELRKWNKSGEKLIPSTKGIRMSLECFFRLVRLRTPEVPTTIKNILVTPMAMESLILVKPGNTRLLALLCRVSMPTWAQ